MCNKMITHSNYVKANAGCASECTGGRLSVLILGIKALAKLFISVTLNPFLSTTIKKKVAVEPGYNVLCVFKLLKCIYKTRGKNCLNGLDYKEKGENGL